MLPEHGGNIMYEDEEYGFCPECGALMKNGVCISCGYDRNKKATDTENTPSDPDKESDGFLSGETPNTGTETEDTPDMSSWEGQNTPDEQPSPDAQNTSDAVPNPAYGTPDTASDAQSAYGTQNAPYGSQNAPYGGQNAPYGSPNASYEAQNTSGGSQGTPYGSQNTPYGAQNTPYGQNMPYGSQNTYGGQNTSYGAQGAPGSPQNVPYGQNVPPYGAQNNAGSMPGGPQNGAYGGQYGQGYGPGQGGYQGQVPPGGVPPYGSPYGAYPNGPQKRNNGRTLAAVIIAAIAILLCIVLVLVYVIVRGAVKESGGGLANYKGVFGSTENSEPESVPEDNGGYNNNNGGYGGAESEPEEEDYVPTPEDDYYVTLANSVRDDLSYSVEWEEYDYVDDETGATTQGRYPQLKGGNIPHMDELNEEIKYEATYYSNLYGYYREQQEEDLYYASTSQGYVTYMDEEKISIVLRESFAMNMESYISLYSINIDLVSGELMDNGNMIDYTPKLAKAFRDQDAYQNGTAQAVDEMTDEQLQDFLSDSDTNIIFYTPVGLEIGFNYTTSSSSGWVTVTIKDYERYMKKI